MANNELLEEVMQHIELNNDLWHQGDWFRMFVNGWDYDKIKALLLEDPEKPPCGSAGCFAGTACTLSGWVPVFHPPTDWQHQDYWVASEVRPKDDVHGDRCGIPGLARELLGLDEYTADRLFEGTNSVSSLRELVDRIKEYGTLKDEDYYEEYECDCEACREPDEAESDVSDSDQVF